MANILLIEDDNALNTGLCCALELEGYRVLSAQNVSQGRELLKQQQADLLLLDGSLPDGDGFLELDFGKLTAKRGGAMLELTATEFKILALLLANENQVITKTMFLEKIWDCEGNFVDEHVVPVNISRLRSKIEDNTHKYIKTVYGMGYQWIRGEEVR